MLRPSLFGGVSRVSYEIRFTAVRTAPGAPLRLSDPTAAALETWSATFLVSAR